MAHHLEVFCKSQNMDSREACGAFLAALRERGTGLVVESSGGHYCELVPEPERVDAPPGGVVLVFDTDQDGVSRALARVECESGGHLTPGVDLLVEVILTGNLYAGAAPEVLSLLSDLWHGVPYDEMSGFDI
jgi:hypothetical protein